jgi:hypothetical protein
LYEIQQQQQQQIKTTTKLLQTFPKEHPSNSITSLLQINTNTLTSASWSSSNPDDNVIVIWSKSKSSSLQYEPIQRITKKEAGGDIYHLVVMKQKKEGEEEEEFASCSSDDKSIIIWRRGKGDEGKFQIKQKIENVKHNYKLLYISLTNELISGSYPFSSPLLQIWSSSSSSSSPSSPSSSSDFVVRQKIKTTSPIWSLCQINKNDTSKRIEFASGHRNGLIMIWSKQQQINGSNHYSIRTLQPFKTCVNDLILINDNGRFDCLIACSHQENKIVIYKEGEEKEGEELEHKEVVSLIPMSNGQFASGGHNQCLNIWSPSSSFCS